MSLITIDELIPYTESLFKLIILAANRAHQLSKGSIEAKVPWNNDKAPIVALREIMAGIILLMSKNNIGSRVKTVNICFNGSITLYNARRAAIDLTS